MWRHRDRRSVWPSLLSVWVPLLLLVAGVQVQAQGDSNNTSTSSSSSSSSSIAATTTITTHDAVRSLPPSNTAAQSTCESRTVNYITHTLPQQCLTTTHSPTPVPSPEGVAADPASAQTPTAAAAPSDAATGQPPVVEEEHELDSDGNDLSTGAFMSFEEWKAMMLKKAGQEPMEARTRKPHDGRDYPGGDDLGSIGEEGEISLDFDAYSDKISEITSSGKPVSKNQKNNKNEKEQGHSVEKVTYDEGLAHVYRSKDAGKTCKERYSYSSFDAGATVIKTSPGAKNSKAILVENKDSYMLLECATANKFFIVELSEDILVDTVVLANYEFFSSMIRQFRVSVSDRYPIKSDKWKVLGDFQARNSRDIQPFLVQNPQIWARYLRIEILSHYGNEYYCPLSLLRVHGARMLDSWKEADPADFEDEESSKATPEPFQETETLAEEPHEGVVEVEEPVPVEDTKAVTEQSLVLPFWDGSYLARELQLRTTCKVLDSTLNASSTTLGENTTSASLPTAERRHEIMESSKAQAETARPSSQNPTTEPTGSVKMATTKAPAAATSAAAANSTEGPAIPKTSVYPVESTQSSGPPIPPTKHTVPASARPSSVATAAKSKGVAGSSSVKPPSSKASQNSKASTGGSFAASSRNRTATPTGSAPASTPTVQDSFFKQLTKRLQTLESNTTLSLQYIESQSQFLQQALSKLERRQVAKVDLFLDTLNKTVLSELRDLRVQYDQIWQSTVIALETQRDQSEREILAVSSRLGALADEVVFQKRMAIVQSVLLLGCLFLVIFSGRLANGGVELYYPSQFLANGGRPTSRMGSPMYPSTPKGGGTRRFGGGRQQERSPPTGLRHSIEDSDMNNTPPRQQHHKPLPSLPMDGLDEDDRRSNDGSMRQSIEERTPTPEPEARRAMSEPHITQRHLHPIRATTMVNPSSYSSNKSINRHDEQRPPNKRAVSDSAGLEYYQPPTPASLQEEGEEDMGYDSEPNMPRNRRPDRPNRKDAEREGDDRVDGDEDGERDYFCSSHSRSRTNSSSSSHQHHHQRPSSSSSSLAHEETAATAPPATSSSSATSTTTASTLINALPIITSRKQEEDNAGGSERPNDILPPHHLLSSTCSGGSGSMPGHEDLQNGMEPVIEGDYNGITATIPTAGASQRAARPLMSHTGSLRKPLPSLPEDPDPDPDLDPNTNPDMVSSTG